VAQIGATAWWGGTPPNYPATGTTGRGVVIGVVDTGLDIAHADFRTASGTRVAWLWDQYTAGTRPAGFTYGAEFSAAQINAGAYIGKDTDGHGTTITGVAAGNGRATGGGRPAYTYVGVAPEATLIIVKSTLGETRVADGVRYVFNKASQMGRPAV